MMIGCVLSVDKHNNVLVSMDLRYTFEQNILICLWISFCIPYERKVLSQTHKQFSIYAVSETNASMVVYTKIFMVS